MKQKSFFFLIGTLVCHSLVCGQTLSPRLDTNRGDYLQIPKARDSDITPFTNTIKTYNNGILELYTPPVGNQGDQGSCTGWAFGYGCASIQAYEVYQDWKWARRSPSFLFNHKQVNCEAANTIEILNLLRDTGVCSYYLMPYDENDCETLPDSNAIQYADAMLNRSMRLSVSLTDVSEYKQYLQIGHPIGIVTNYARDLKRVWNSTTLNGLWNAIVNTSTDSIHAMCIVGYDDNQQLFKVMNSWDSIKGDNGFVWVSYNLVQNGIFSEAYVFRADTNGFVPQIEGPYTMSDTTAWYYVKNYPQGQNISWSIHNISATIFEFVTASEQGRDSMRVAYRAITYNPPGPVFPPVALSRYKYADLTVTVGSGDDTYSTTKRIRRQTSSYPMSSPARIDNTSYTLELWHSIYGLLRTQPAQSAEDSIDTSGLSQGLYIIILKENGQPIKQTKLLIP